MKKLILLTILTCLIAPCMVYAQTKTIDSIQQNNSDNNYPPAVDPGINKSESKKQILATVEVLPKFNGDLHKFLQKNLNYPMEAMENEIQGRVIAKFVVLANGKIDPKSIEITKGLGYGTDEEVRRVIRAMPDWIPAKQDGEAVNYRFILPVSFNLE